MAKSSTSAQNRPAPTPAKAAKTTPKAAGTAAAPTKAAVQAAPGKVGKGEVTRKMAEQLGLTQAQAGEAFDVVVGAISGALRAGQVVGVPGLGTFRVRATAARQGVRPGSGETIQIAAGKRVQFSSASTLKREL